MTSKSEITYSKLFSKLVELEQGLNPTRIMVDFQKAAINALEDNFYFCYFRMFLPFVAKCLPTNSIERPYNSLSGR